MSGELSPNWRLGLVLGRSLPRSPVTAKEAPLDPCLNSDSGSVCVFLTHR